MSIAYQVKFLISFLCILVVSESYGQLLLVKDQETNELIEGVAVFNVSKSVSFVTTSKGELNLTSFPDNDSIHFQHPAYPVYKATKQQLLQLPNRVLLLKEKVYNLESIVFFAPLRGERGVIQTFQSDVIGSESMRINNAQTTADVLEQSGQVLIQKSQAGGGSPIIRGFEASRVLLVVDGVRLNNAIYRSGHLQNAITIDQNILESTEVFFGPGSVIYGSDALGGVVHFHSRQPKLSISDTTLSSVNVMLRYGSVNREKTTHLDVELGGKRVGSLSSITFSEFGDLRMGKNRNGNYPNYGLIPFYSSTKLQKDSMLLNPNENVHINSGYKQLDLLQKFYWEINEKASLDLNFQYSTSSDIPRYDRLTETKGEHLKFAEWYYGPQNRLLSSFSLDLKGKSIFDQLRIVGAYQFIEEDRQNRKFSNQSISTRKVNEEDVRVYSLNADFRKEISKRTSLFYGVEITSNDVTSKGYNLSLIDDTRTDTDSRYPSGGSSMNSQAAYLSTQSKLTSVLSLNTGIRLSRVSLDANYGNTFQFTLPYQSINFTNTAISYSGGLLASFDGTKIRGSFATGFRSPNLDDATKIREKAGVVTVPNEQLSPEYASSSELGLEKDLSEQVSIEIVGYYTALRDAIVTEVSSLNGKDSMLFDGDWATIQTNVNSEKAYIYGGMFELNWKISKNWNWLIRYNYTKGFDVSNDRPLAHIPPIYGLTEFQFSKNKLTLKASILYNGWKKTEDFGTGTADNPSHATDDGFTSWYTLNLKSDYKIMNHLNMQLGVTNLLDRHYKPFASGISGAGRNLYAALRFNF